MAIPFLAIAQAINVLLPITPKRSMSEEAEAKQVIASNHGPVSTSIGNILMGGGVVYGSTEDAVMGVITSLVGLGFYLFDHRND